MITLYSYPTLFGVVDNNSYGLKVFAFMRLADLPFAHEARGHLHKAQAVTRIALDSALFAVLGVVFIVRAVLEASLGMAHASERDGCSTPRGLGSKA
jgi:hypothetical protein